MLVLVVGTAALLFTWIQSNGTGAKAVTYSQFLTDVKDGNVPKVDPAGRDPDGQQQGHRADLHRHRPGADRHQGLRRHASWPPRPATWPLIPDYGAAAGARHVVARAAADRPPAAPRHRRLHLLHDAPGPGHQQPGPVVRQEPRPDVPRQQDGRHVQRRGRRRRGQDGAPGSRRVPQVPGEVQLARRPHPARRPAGRTSRHRQDADGARRRR